MTDPYVWMRHPTLPDNAPVQAPRAAFDAVYQHMGWEEADAAGVTQADLDAALRPEPAPAPEPDAAEPDEAAPTGGRRAARGKAGTPKDKE